MLDFLMSITSVGVMFDASTIGFGRNVTPLLPAVRFDEGCPLRRQSHELPFPGIESRVHPVLEVAGHGNGRLLFLLGKHVVYDPPVLLLYNPSKSSMKGDHTLNVRDRNEERIMWEKKRE